MLDEETGAEPRVTSASIADPFLLLIREDSSIFIAQINSHSELEEVEKEDKVLSSTKWTGGCLYKDIRGLFAPVQTDKGATDGESVFMFLLSAAGALHVCSPPIFSPSAIANPLRSTDYRIYPNPSTSPRACPTSRRCYQPTILGGAAQAKRPSPKFLCLILEIRHILRRTSS